VTVSSEFWFVKSQINSLNLLKLKSKIMSKNSSKRPKLIKHELFAFGRISESDVKAMVKKHYANSSNGNGFDPNTHVKSVWFPINQINYMQSQLQAEVATMGADGVRVYFGNYPKIDSTGKPFPNPDSDTVIFVSTYWDGINHVDYFTEVNTFDPQNRGEQCQPHCGGTITTP